MAESFLFPFPSTDMALQPQDEQSDLHDTYQFIDLNISQYLQNDVFNSISDLNFSSITDIASGSSSNIQNPDVIEQDSSKSDELMNNVELDFEDMFCEERFNSFTKQLDLMQLELLDQSIDDRIMSVEVQPPTDIRRRYESDGKRQIEKSRSKPMSIKLPNLENCKLNSDASFWLQLFLLTTDQNPSNTAYIHSDKLEYHADDILMSDYGSVRIRITQDDIREGVKQLARISIVKKKLDAYTFELIPFNLLSTNTPMTIYENQNTKSVVAKAKCFRDLYNLTSSCIACQLVIRQNDTWHMTNIVCKTDTMEEKKQTDDKRSTKRAITSDINDDGSDQVVQRSPTKKRKSSLLVVKDLPVTRYSLAS